MGSARYNTMVDQDPGPVNVEFRGIRKLYGSKEVLGDVSISIRKGELLTLLGPSGCGKTTLLRILAGFAYPTVGEVCIDGECINDIPPSDRNVGLVFQNYSLFPHMSVFDNVAFGLKMRRMERKAIQDRVRKVLDLVHMGDHMDEYPGYLSGGMQQRVALARVLAIRPRVLLLDEPFGAIDRRLRDEMQVEVRKLQHKLEITTLFVTHDQQEALIMSDRIAVMSKGKIEQEGFPLSIYDRPQNRFVAEFLGIPNLIPGRIVTEMVGSVTIEFGSGFRLDVPVSRRPEKKEVTLAFRAECIAIDPSDYEPARIDTAPDRTSQGSLKFPGKINFVTNLGSRVGYEVQVEDGPTLFVESQRVVNSVPYREGDIVTLAIRGDQCALLSE